MRFSTNWCIQEINTLGLKNFHLEYSASVVKGKAFCFPSFFFFNWSSIKVSTIHHWGVPELEERHMWKKKKKKKVPLKSMKGIHLTSQRCYAKLGLPRKILFNNTKQALQRVLKNRLQLMISLIIKWLTKQACALRSYDEFF